MIHYIDQAGLKLRGPLVCVSQELELKVHTTMPSHGFCFDQDMGCGDIGNPKIEVVGIILRIDPVILFLGSSPGLHR